MKKSELRGTRDVFVFTLVQTLKNRAFLIFMILMLVLAMASGPIMQLVMDSGNESGSLVGDDGEDDDEGDGEEDGEEGSAFSKLYVFDEFGFAAMGYDVEAVLAENYPDIPLQKYDGKAEDFEAFLEERKAEEPTEAAVHLYLSEIAGLAIEVLHNEECETVALDVAATLGDSFVEWKKTASGATEEQLAVMDTELHVSMGYVGEDGAISDERYTDGISDSQYWIIYGLLFITMMVNVTASSQIATAIATDKSTKVVEYLLTSVRPLALIIGKVLAMLVAAVGQMILLFALAYASSAVSGLVTGKEGYLKQLMPADVWSSINLPNTLLAIVAIVLGFIFFALLAGLCGATVSRLEDIQEGMTLLTVVSLIGVYTALISSGIMMDSASNPMVIFSLLFPLSSPFLLPGGLLTGCVEMWMAVPAIALLIVADILMFRFVATMYEMLITHNGNKIKLKELFGLCKSIKKGGAKA